MRVIFGSEGRPRRVSEGHKMSKKRPRRVSEGATAFLRRVSVAPDLNSPDCWGDPRMVKAWLKISTGLHHMISHIQPFGPNTKNL